MFIIMGPLLQNWHLKSKAENELIYIDILVEVNAFKLKCMSA